MSQYCELCKIKVSRFNEDHLLKWHKMTKEQYLQIYPNAKIDNYNKRRINKKQENRLDIYSYINIQNKSLRVAIYQAFNSRCFYTGKEINFETMHIDHLIPKNRGGEDCIANYVLTSSFTNLSKRNKQLDNINELIKKNITIYAPKVLELLMLKYTPRSPYPRYNPQKCIYKYTRLLAEPQNKLQEEFLEKLNSIKRDNNTPLSVKKLEWLTELYQFWKENKLDKF